MKTKFLSLIFLWVCFFSLHSSAAFVIKKSTADSAQTMLPSVQHNRNNFQTQKNRALAKVLKSKWIQKRIAKKEYSEGFPSVVTIVGAVLTGLALLGLLSVIFTSIFPVVFGYLIFLSLPALIFGIIGLAQKNKTKADQIINIVNICVNGGFVLLSLLSIVLLIIILGVLFK